MRFTFLFLLLAWLNACLTGQTMVNPDYVAHYEFQSPTDTSTLSLTPPEGYMLIAYENESRFLSSNKQFNDSMSYEFSLKNPGMNNPTMQEEVDELVEKFTEELSKWQKSEYSTYTISKNIDERIIKNPLYAAFPPQHMEFPFLRQWNITNVTDTISGLYCQQAKIKYGGRDYTAWFAPEIPISDGPYVFSGLPGLIVKITDSRGWYTFQLASFERKPAPHYWNNYFVNTLSRAISRDSYVSQILKYKEAPSFHGVLNESEEDALLARKKYANHFYFLIEQN